MANFNQDALQSFLETYGENDTASIPPSTSQCCCGNDACTYLKHNQAALDDLERELQTSARLGQALLVRHETYMLDAEQQRKHMSRQLEELELEKKTLQQQNNTLVQENRGLLDQLEALNNAVSDSDAQISSLQATLQSAQQEVQKLAQLAERTESLERELALFEHEQATWQASLSVKEQAEKTALRRWHDAERMLARMQEQLHRIERESTEEKERHAEIVARIERRHAVEIELEGTADRLKRDMSAPDPRGSGVVSHFVKDILQDNATLQLGIVELREMLQNSNDEVEKLREQLLLHQPATAEEEGGGGEGDCNDRPTADRSVSLNDELTRTKAQELHVHHHYHAPSPAAAAAAQRSNSLRRPKKKRPITASTAMSFTPTSSGRSTPRSSVSFHPGTSAAAILQQTTVSIPREVSAANRHSTHSVYTAPSLYAVSVPSSPTSTTHHASSLFDRVFSDAGNESTSPPTSDSEAFSSPHFEPVGAARQALKRPKFFKGHSRGFSSGPGKQSLDSILDASVEDLPQLDPLDEREVIDETDEPDWRLQLHRRSDHAPRETHDDTSHDYGDRAWSRPALRRAASHESLLSVSGMDIHTLKERPSQMLVPNARMSSGAVISNLQAHAARAPGTSAAQRSGRSILSGMAADQRKPALMTPRPGLGKKSSGWFFGRWGTSVEEPAQTKIEEVPPTRASMSSSHRTSSFASSNSDKPALMGTPKPLFLRSPGINQAGPILGFGPETKVTHAPVVKTLDQDALSKALDDTR